MQTLFLISLAFFAGRYVNKLFRDDALEQPGAIEQKYKNVKYYSNGLELPFPFHMEYRIIVNAMEGSWMFQPQHQELVNENHEAPILERAILKPIKKEYTYTFNHVFLADAFLKEQQDYLENLN